ncbi:hypothetical protein GCM10028808_72850 [Spirosoma migulaei]
MHPGVRQSYVAHRLYGGNKSTARAKLHNKLYGVEGREFTPDELEKLYQIRKEFLQELL